MILGLLISIGAVALVLWLVLMFMWWRKERQKADPLVTAAASTLSGKCMRLARRGWYAIEMQAGKAGMWCNKKATRLFLSLFPSAAPAFAKKDELAGLSHGPSSFFLMSISQEQKVQAKQPIIRKKIV